MSRNKRNFSTLLFVYSELLLAGGRQQAFANQSSINPMFRFDNPFYCDTKSINRFSRPKIFLQPPSKLERRMEPVCIVMLSAVLVRTAPANLLI